MPPPQDLPAEEPGPEAGPLVLFDLSGQPCALPRSAVRALLPLPRLDSPPGLPSPLAGFMNLGGTAVPVVELALLLGLPRGEPHPYRHLILLDRPAGGPESAFALLVDRVADVLPAGLPLRPLGAERSPGGIVTGEIATPVGSAHLLDPARLLLAQEAAILEALSEQAQRRLAQWGTAGDLA
ncbi:chemotaxis protein CheW [Roseomonas chloroacetimidivorans]|uniref:chemotaxis protein CheW n=1 Tax=Roseomonas chloroacetimidivorans TaxID=1766656 RepID=UPI003C78491D